MLFEIVLRSTMRRWLLLALLAPLVVMCGHAQVAVYLTSSSDHFSNVPTGLVSGGGSNQEQYASYWTSGIGGGLTLTFLPLGPVKLGFDFRGSTRPGTTGADTAMGGIKLGISPPLIRIKPYVEVAGGYVATRTVNVSTNPGSPNQTVGGTFSNKYAAWEILGGIDYRLVKFVDLRLIEVGAGKGVNIPGIFGAPDLTLVTVNSGLVVHF
jgi:hypothetical protein